MRSLRLGVVSGLLVALGAWRHAAAAELQVAGPRSCSRQAELRARVERALGRALTELGDLRCNVHVVRDGGSYAARFEVSSTARRESLQRSFSAKTCPKLMETLELAVVLAAGEVLDADVPAAAGSNRERAPISGLAQAPRRARSASNASPARASDRASSSDAAALAKAAPDSKTPATFALSAATPHVEGAHAIAAMIGEPANEQAAQATTEHDRAEHAAAGGSDGHGLWRVLGGVVLDAGALPGPALGAQLGASFGDELELRALGTHSFPREASVAGSSAHGVELALTSATVLGCAPQLLRPADVELGLCAGGELGWLRGAGSELARSQSTATLWSALRADIGARWQLAPSWFGIEARAGVAVPLQRERFMVSTADPASSLVEAHQPSAIGGRLSLAATFALDGEP